MLPGTSIHAIVEYTHRTAASIVGLLWLALAVQAWRRYRPYRWVTTAGFGLVVAQGLLGALVVDKNLQDSLVAAHLGMAMLLFALSIWLARAVRLPRRTAKRPAPAPIEGVPGRFVSGRFKALAFSAQAALFGAIVAGGYMAGSEKDGLALWAKTRHLAGAHYQGAHYACGHQFPTCNDGFLPFGSRLVNIHLVHRVFVYLVSIALVSLVVMALRRRPSDSVVRAAKLVAALLVVQILLGGLNVWLTHEYEVLIVAHLTTATLLWAALTTLTMQLFRVPAPAPEPSPRLSRQRALAT